MWKVYVGRGSIIEDGRILCDLIRNGISCIARERMYRNLFSFADNVSLIRSSVVSCTHPEQRTRGTCNLAKDSFAFESYPHFKACRCLRAARARYYLPGATLSEESGNKPDPITDPWCARPLNTRVYRDVHQWSRRRQVGMMNELFGVHVTRCR